MKSIMLKLLIVSMSLNLVTLPISNAIAVIFGYLCLISSALLPVELLWYNGGRVNKKQFLIVLAFAVIIIVNSQRSLIQMQSGELEGLIKALVSFLAFILTICVGGITYSEKDFRFYFAVIRLFAIVLILYTVLPFGFRYTTIDNYGNQQFTLSMGNPNATAAKVLFCIIILIIENAILKNVWLARFNVLLIVGLLYTLIKLESRTSLLCALIGVTVGGLLRMQVKKWMVNLAWVIPLGFIPIQILIQRFPIWILLNKSFSTGRETLFVNFISQIISDPFGFILGDFAENQLANYHNIFFTLLYNFGIVGFILYFFFWKNEKEEYDDENSVISNFAWMGIIVLIIHSMAEAAAMSGSFTFGAIVILLNRMTKDQFIAMPDKEDRYDLTYKPRVRRKRKANVS